nr:hypothetical protein [Tanacetum cinerariifolium]
RDVDEEMRKMGKDIVSFLSCVAEAEMEEGKLELQPKRRKVFNSFALSYSSARLCVFRLRATVTSSSKLARDQTSNPTSSASPTLKGRIRRSSKQKVENSHFEEHLTPVATMTDNRTMAEMLRAVRRWLEKEPSRSVTTWDDLQKFDESFHEAWERYKDLLRACPHHGFTELHPLDTFYNALNPADQDSLNAAAGDNLLEKSPQDALTIIENKSKVRNPRSKPIASPVNACDINSSSEIAKLTHAVNQQTSVVTTAMTAMLKQLQLNPPPAQVKAVEEICVTCGGAHPYYQCLAAGGNTFPEFRDNIQGGNTFPEFRDNIQGYVSAAASNDNQGNPGYCPQGVGSGSLPGNTIANPKGKLKAITTRSGLVTDGPTVPTPAKSVNPEEDECVEETYTDPDLMKYTIKALVLMPKYQKMLKALLSNKEKLQELANTHLNENCSAVILKKLPEKLRDPGKFLIPCGFSELKCKAVADLGASINLMPLEDCLEVLVSNKQSSNPTFLLHKEMASPEVIHEIHDSKVCIFLSEEFPNIDSFNDIHPYFDDDPLSGSTTYSANSLLEEFTMNLLLSHILRIMMIIVSVISNSIDQSDLANLDDLFVDPTPEMFTDEQPPNYSFPPRFDVDDDLPSPDNEDKVFNPGILIHEKWVKIITRVAQEKKLSISYAFLVFEDFDPPIYELLVFKEVPNSMRLLPFSSENEENVFKLGIYTSEKVKEYHKKDKIGSKQDKNEKRGEAGKSQKQLQ